MVSITEPELLPFIGKILRLDGHPKPKEKTQNLNESIHDSQPQNLAIYLLCLSDAHGVKPHAQRSVQGRFRIRYPELTGFRKGGFALHIHLANPVKNGIRTGHGNGMVDIYIVSTVGSVFTGENKGHDGKMFPIGTSLNFEIVVVFFRGSLPENFRG
jgi:hypothetical protein